MAVAPMVIMIVRMWKMVANAVMLQKYIITIKKTFKNGLYLGFILPARLSYANVRSSMCH